MPALFSFSSATLNVESPEENPEIQKGSGISLKKYSGLSTGTISGNSFFNSSESPLLRLYLIPIICLRPSIVKCLMLPDTQYARVYSGSMLCFIIHFLSMYIAVSLLIAMEL